jgi:hypothetical protein
MKIKRYDIYGENESPICNEDEYGDYVKYSDVERLIAERQQLQKDAERYRWLRRNNPSNSNVWCVKGANGVSNDTIDSSQLDDAVDEAMSEYLKD